MNTAAVQNNFNPEALNQSKWVSFNWNHYIQTGVIMQSSQSSMVLILWTAATLEEARRICHELVEKRLIACANIIPHVESIYLWENKVENASESKVFLKTLDFHFIGVRDYIKEHCSYDVPEVSMLQIDSGNPDYFQWIEAVVSKSVNQSSEV